MTEVTIFDRIRRQMRDTEEGIDRSAMIRRALGQTYRAGMKYVTVPDEWWLVFTSDKSQDEGCTGVPWGDLCSSINFKPDSQETQVCLREWLHDGPCGWDLSVIEP